MRYIIGLLLGIGLIVLTFILIFRAFSGGSDAPKQQPINLNDYANTDTVVRYTMDGPVNANDKHNRVRITVSKDQVVFEQIQGYEGKLIQNKTFPSNTQSFATFLRSLQFAGFAKGDKAIDDDERGYCPLGRRYVYEAVDGGDILFRWWSVSCNQDTGSYRGAPSTARTLFQRQVPDYGRLTSGLQL